LNEAASFLRGAKQGGSYTLDFSALTITGMAEPIRNLVIKNS